jgi:hypothetical protein
MTFFEQLKHHVYGLINLKKQLYWSGIGMDNISERICILVDVKGYDAGVEYVAYTHANDMSYLLAVADDTAAVLLFIDGIPKWIWVYNDAVEFIE